MMSRKAHIGFAKQLLFFLYQLSNSGNNSADVTLLFTWAVS